MIINNKPKPKVPNTKPWTVPFQTLVKTQSPKPQKNRTNINEPGEIKTYTVGFWLTTKGLSFWRWDDKIVDPNDPNWESIAWRTVVQANCIGNAIDQATRIYKKQLEEAA